MGLFRRKADEPAPLRAGARVTFRLDGRERTFIVDSIHIDARDFVRDGRIDVSLRDEDSFLRQNRVGGR